MVCLLIDKDIQGRAGRAGKLLDGTGLCKGSLPSCNLHLTLLEAHFLRNTLLSSYTNSAESLLCAAICDRQVDKGDLPYEFCE